MLRSNMNEYKEIAKAVSRVEVYKDAFAISIFNGDGIDTPTVGGAKTANDLLDISGIKASFVITPYEDKIYVSARSIDEVNVQLVMEKLKKIDEVAYVRFASVYRQFKDINTFMRELNKLLSSD